MNNWYTILILQTKPWLNIHDLSTIRGTFCILLHIHRTVINAVFQVRFKTINVTVSGLCHSSLNIYVGLLCSLLQAPRLHTIQTCCLNETVSYSCAHTFHNHIFNMHFTYFFFTCPSQSTSSGHLNNNA